ncbi:MAG TPA: NAD-dependent epimerase/dehydratase family protein [Candidatus Paceibacterota bacterium]|nr:NAD-dependent epimerase/dehydratase family protein [Candidatus Paceibacterota bacterium]
MKTLITGGAGFVGFHLAKRLAGQGHEVVIADNLVRGKRDLDLEALLRSPNVSLKEVDLTNLAAWSDIGDGYEAVYHLASINGTKLFYDIPHEVLRIGALSSIYALEWFRTKNGVANAKILYTSSNEAYASALEAFGILPIPTPENVPLVIADTYNPRWSYGGQKLFGELLFINYARAYKLRMSIVRPHNFYGPRAGSEHAIPQIAKRAFAKEDPFAIYGADETRSFCYIDDAVEAMQRVMESSVTDNGTYHIGTSIETDINELTEKIFDTISWHPEKIEAKQSPAGSVKRRLPDVSKIKKDTGWEAATTLEEGLQKTIDWYKEHL